MERTRRRCVLVFSCVPGHDTCTCFSIKSARSAGIRSRTNGAERPSEAFCGVWKINQPHQNLIAAISRVAGLRMSEIIIRHDPKFILRRPERRPSWIEHIGGIPVDDRSFIHLPERWVEPAKDSLSLLHPRTSDDRVVLGESTRLRHLREEWPEEDRMAVVRLAGADELWQDVQVDEGYPPFARWRGVQVARYMDLEAPPDHVIIAHAGYHFETPGACWLALNPALGRALGWHPIPGGWFRWADEKGVPVVESFWWGDGPVHQCTEHLLVEVGSGWLVLATEQAFERIRQWARQLSRGGVIRRSRGWGGDAGRSQAIGVLRVE